MIRFKTAAITFCLLGALPMAVSAQSSQFGPDEGDREFSLAGTGSNDRDFNSGSFGGIYGDGVKDSAFAGLEAGLKYYVQTKTYFLARAEYQFLFSDTNAFQNDGIWAYTVGLGYNF